MNPLRILVGSWSASLALTVCFHAHGQRSGDFNGDGFDDLAFAVVLEDIAGMEDAGAVNVIYGSSNGLRSAGNQFWHQNSSGISDDAEAGDRFGFAIAVGDFNGDGFDDLAIGVPGEDIDGVQDAGAVNVLYGSSAGLRSMGEQFWHQNRAGIRDACDFGDQFGAALAAGDLNNDGRDDLAIGIPGETVAGFEAAGAVAILYGHPSGLRHQRNQFAHQNTRRVQGAPEAFDNFGHSLAIGNFNGDRFADLAIGVPGESIGNAIDAGAVQILFGSSGGLRARGNEFWHQNSRGIRNHAEPFDRFGSTLAAGSFDGDRFDDLAIGVYFEDIGDHFDAGAVHVLRGTANGLTEQADQFWSRTIHGFGAEIKDDDRLGYALIAHDFNGDRRDDLAIGVPRGDVQGVFNAGAVHVLYGAGEGLRLRRRQVWHQNTAGIQDVAEPNDQFGSTFAAGDYNGDGFADLAVAVHIEDVQTVADAGAINVIYGSANRLTAAGDQFWHQNSPGIADSAEFGDNAGIQRGP